MPNENPNEVKIADNIPGAEYTNMMQVGHTKEEFNIVYFNVMPPSGKVVGKIITTPGHFKRMIAAMQDNLQKYEAQFGKIEEAEAPGKELGFRS
ncbi:DUF3467 domain-containing protein [Patescibacteria group bacterium]|nr:DUF3467 domain-containing protein [Patescibacteria group bacterium]